MQESTPIELPPRILAARKRAVFLLLVLSLAFALASPPLRAQGVEGSGKDVFDSTCATCHATGVDGAPKVGDKEAWSERASQGLSSLTRHALDGIRKMPAHGGRSELSDLEIARAVTYMVNRSGGNWVEPTSAQNLARERSGEQVVKAQCVKCHGEGLGGAPKIGDLKAWVERIKHGLNHAVQSAIHGHGGMPPRGGQANLTDAEIRSAILYMYGPTAASAKSSSAARSREGAVTTANHKTTHGIEVYLGFMPANKLRELPKGTPERSMHVGIPRGSGYYHVNVSLYDQQNQAPLTDAQVRMQFEQPGLTRAETELEPMAISAGSYGKYIKPQPRSRYIITIRIKKAHASRAVEAKFEHTFE
jgi:cytochrome c5